MIEAAGITLRESIEAILVIFVMVAYLKRTNQQPKTKVIYGGALLAVGVSIILGITLHSIGIDPENELVEGILYFTAALMVLSLTVWMMRHAHQFKSEIEQRMQKSTSAWMLGFVAFIMVLREGAEIVVFMQSLLLSGNTPVQNFVGALFGILLSLFFGFVFLRGSIKINISHFFRVTSVILVILVVQLTANGLHEFFEVGILPTTDAVMGIVGFLARQSTGAAIIALMLLALVFLVIFDLMKATAPDVEGIGAADRRKLQYRFMKEKYSKIGLAGLVVVLAVPLLAPVVASTEVVSSPPETVKASEGVITVDIPEEDGLYHYEIDGMRFFVIKKGPLVRAALDDCKICPLVGYGYDGEHLVCMNCSAPIDPASVGTPGGCNPKVLDYRVDDEHVTVTLDQLKTAWGR